MNLSTYIKRLTYTKRAYFYDLYINGREGSERDSFNTKFGDDLLFIHIEKIIATLQKPIVDDDVLGDDFFRSEHNTDNYLVAIPGKKGNQGIIPGKDVDLRHFCYKPTAKTLIYLNGYKHSKKILQIKENEAWQYTDFKDDGKRCHDSMKALMKAVSHGVIEFGDNGAIYKFDYEGNKILVDEFPLGEFL